MSRYTSSPAILGLLSLILATGCSPSIKTPTAYKPWNAKDGTFKIDYPEDWEADGGGKQGIQWAEFKKGSCAITVDTNLTASLIGDIAGAGGGDTEEMPEELQPAAAAHKALKDMAVGDKFGNYKEGDAIKITPPIGDGRKSEFTASKGLTKVKGYRATIPQSDKGILVFMYCPAKSWDKLKPAYDKILDGMERGVAE